MTDQNILLQENGYQNAPDIKALRTVTYDPAVYKLVPVAETPEWRANLTEIGYSHKTIIKDVLQSVTDQLPGVVEHSGEPVYLVCFAGLSGPEEKGRWREATEDAYYTFEERNRRILYAHPAPSQPSTIIGFAEGLTSGHITTVPDKSDRIVWKNNYYHLPIKQQPSAEALVQAALEAAAKVCKDYSNNQRQYFGMQGVFAGRSVDDVEVSIRALDKQQIIESCKEKS